MFRGRANQRREERKLNTIWRHQCCAAALRHCRCRLKLQSVSHPCKPSPPLLRAMGAFLDKPNTRKLTQDGQILLRTGGAEACAAPSTHNGAAALPAAYLVKFGGSSMQGWRKYQEDRISYMALQEGRVPLANAAVPTSSTPSPPGIHMVFLSIFDGHGGADTSQYSHIHFHPFLRARVEKRMDEWNRECKRVTAAAAAAASEHRRRRTGSVIEHDNSESSFHSFSSSSSSLAVTLGPVTGATAAAAALPAYPIDSAFLSAAFLDFDASIPLPQAGNIPRNAPPPPPQQSGGMRKQQAVPPPEGNNIPHLASGTTATLCILDLANQSVPHTFAVCLLEDGFEVSVSHMLCVFDVLHCCCLQSNQHGSHRRFSHRGVQQPDAAAAAARGGRG